MSSVRERVIVGAKEVLNATPLPVGIPQAQRARSFAMRAGLFPRILVHFKDDNQEPVGGDWGPLSEHHMRLRVSCYASGSDSIGADEAADPLCVHVEKRLIDAAEDTATTFGQLVNKAHLVESKAIYDQAEFAVVRVDMVFVVEFQSRTDDPEQVA